MKRKICTLLIIFIFLLSCCVCTVTVSAKCNPILLDDTMEDLENWIATTNNAYNAAGVTNYVKPVVVDFRAAVELKAGPANYQKEVNKLLGNDNHAKIETGDTTWGDCEISTTLKVNPAKTDDAQDDYVKLFFKINGVYRCYSLIYKIADKTVSLGRDIRMSADDFYYQDQVAYLGDNFDCTKWNDFKVRMVDNRIQVWVNGGNPVIDFYDSQPIATGGVALSAATFSTGELHVYCDSFRVRGVTQEEPDTTMTNVFTSSEQIMSDSFDNGTSAWVAVNNASGNIAGYAVENTDENNYLKLDVKKTSATDQYALLAGDNKWDNYTFDFIAKSDKGAPGAVIRYIAPNVYYAVRFSTDNNGTVKLIKRNGNDEVTLASRENTGVDFTDWTPVRIRCRDDYIGIYSGYMSEELLVYKDTGSTTLAGKAGFEVTAGADTAYSVLYDEVCVHTNEQNVILADTIPAEVKYAEEYSVNPQFEIYVDVNGSDSGDGSKANPYNTIEKAKARVREMKDVSGDIAVNIAGGTYNLKESLKFDSDDNATDGKVIYRSYDGRAIISGGTQVKNWQETDEPNVWKAHIDDWENLNFEQFYVNEQPKLRAGMWLLEYSLEFYDDPSTTFSSSGVDGLYFDKEMFPKELSASPDAKLWAHTAWRSMALPVNRVYEDPTNSMRYIFEMQQPVFNEVYVLQQAADVRAPMYRMRLDGIRELLDEPGEWYYDKTKGDIYYYCEKGEDINSQTCFVPRIDSLVEIEGESLENKVNNIVFENLDFRYTNWSSVIEPGMANYQSAVNINFDPEMWEKYDVTKKSTYDSWFMEMLKHGIYLDKACNIRFERNTFKCFGAGAIWAENGTENIVITGNVFEDIASNGVTVGTYGATNYEAVMTFSPLLKYGGAYDDKPGESCPKHTYIQNNIFNEIGTVYNTCSAVNTLFVKNTYISNNEISNIGWTPVATGYSWNNIVPQNQADLVVNNNIIRNWNYTQNYEDIGGFYNLGANPGTLVEGNYFDNEFGAGSAVLYHDEGSSYLTSRNNVAFNVNRFSSIRDARYHDNNVINNYHNCPDANWIGGVNSHVVNTHMIDRKNIPVKAKEIIKNAGLQESYADIAERVHPESAVMDDIYQTCIYSDGSTSAVNYGVNRNMTDTRKPAKIVDGVLYLPPAELELITYNNRNNQHGLTLVSRPDKNMLIAAYTTTLNITPVVVEIPVDGNEWSVDGKIVKVKDKVLNHNGQYLIPVEQLYDVLGVNKEVVVDGNTGYVFFAGIDMNNINVPAMTKFYKERY